MEEKRRILEMVRSGEIGVEEAMALLQAVGEERHKASGGRLLRVRIQAWDKGRPVKVHLNLPLALVDFLEGFLPQEARLALGERGVELKDLIRLVREGAPEGRLVEIEAEEEDGPVQILVEVV